MIALDVIEKLQIQIDQFFASRSDPIILEAGCGSGSYIKMPADAKVVGIDISAEELEKNKVVNEKIVGDIQHYQHPPKSYDLIICWDVLEHLPDPQAALSRFDEAIKTGGMILLAFPNVDSLKAKVAKYTPHWFHIMIYKLIYGEKYGTPGVITFPTFLKSVLKPAKMEAFADSHSLQQRFAIQYESGVQKRFRKKFFIGDRMIGFFDGLIRVLSFKTMTLQDSDCIYLLYKNE